MGCWFSNFSADDDDDVFVVKSGSFLTNLVRETRNEDVFDKYEVIRVLGEGSMGAVSCVRVRHHRKGGLAYQKHKHHQHHLPLKKRPSAPDEERDVDVHYALKTIQLIRVSPGFVEELRNEINILRTMDHPNIVRAFEVYEQQIKGQPRIHVVLELCSGGDLYRRTPYSEYDAANIVGQLLSAIKYMHDHDIVHRDLKFENIMFESHRADAEIKVIDFGLSKKFLQTDKERFMTEGVGTIYTMAPQVLQGIYNSQADMWSVGVISYMLLSDTKPFTAKRRAKMIDVIMRGDYHAMTGPAWEHTSKEAKKFCKDLLQLDPDVRLDANKALHHDWMSRKFNASERKPRPSLMDGVTNSLCQYRQTSALQRVARNIIAHQASTEEIFQLRKAFEQFDVSHDGVITYEEFKQGLIDRNYSEDIIKEIFNSVDINENGLIWFTEFLAACLEVQGRIVEERIAEAFDRIDEDSSGYISRRELSKLLGKDFNVDQINQIIEETDVDGDGQISYEEFMKAFRVARHPLGQQISHSTSPKPVLA